MAGFGLLPASEDLVDERSCRTVSREALVDRHDANDKAETDLREQAARFSEHEGRLRERKKDAQAVVDRIDAELTDTVRDRREVEGKLNEIHMKRHLVPKRQGPLEWVDGSLFGAACNLVVAMNLTFMAKHTAIHKYSEALAAAADNLFLVWYVFELTLKIMHHRKHFLFGQLSAVCWNWLDFGIVAGGVVDQWAMPLLGGAGGGSFLSVLRLLRLFRLLRFFKLMKAFLVSDLSWIGESKAFELFMSAVVAVNGVTISFELDVAWAGWFWVDNVFLVIYGFDVALRLKRWGSYFFVHPDDLSWNWLDFVVVGAGVVDSWLMPGINLVETEIMGVDSEIDTSKLTKVMSLMKLMRLLRVLRLVKLLRCIPPLYTLLVGVIDAFKSMQWVIILTLLTLYAGAIVFTNLVGHGLIYGDADIPPSAMEVFGTVPESLFSLFELMNGDTSVIEPIKSLLVGKLLFVGFMVISNWAILAILTSVVSDNMMSASNQFRDDQEEQTRAAEEKKNHDKLLDLFEDRDANKTGVITKEQWSAMLDDKLTLKELCDDTSLDKTDLLDLFECVCVAGDGSSTVEYDQLIEGLKANSAQADNRSVMHVMLRLRIMQDQFKTGFDEIKDMIKHPQVPVK